MSNEDKLNKRNFDGSEPHYSVEDGHIIFKGPIKYAVWKHERLRSQYIKNNEKMKSLESIILETQNNIEEISKELKVLDKFFEELENG